MFYRTDPTGRARAREHAFAGALGTSDLLVPLGRRDQPPAPGKPDSAMRDARGPPTTREEYVALIADAIADAAARAPRRDAPFPGRRRTRRSRPSEPGETRAALRARGPVDRLRRLRPPRRRPRERRLGARAPRPPALLRPHRRRRRRHVPRDRRRHPRAPHTQVRGGLLVPGEPRTVDPRPAQRTPRRGPPRELARKTQTPHRTRLVRGRSRRAHPPPGFAVPGDAR